MNRQQMNEVLVTVEQSVTELFQKNTPAYLIYHNVNHTRAVVDHAKEIAYHNDLDDNDYFILLAAAWFHDTGQMFSSPEWHEEKSVNIANDFFAELTSVPVNLVTSIDHCILSTKMPQRPQRLVEEILCDADLYHLGTKNFPAMDQRVMEEAKLRGLPIIDWKIHTISLMRQHRFHTAYCQNKLAEGKAENLQLLERN